MKIIKFIGFIIIVVGIGFGFYNIHKENMEIKAIVYKLLEKDEMTEDEKYFVEGSTNPDITKDFFVILDDEHREMFKVHFGHER